MTCIICEREAVMRFSSIFDIFKDKEYENQGFCELHNVIHCSENKNYNGETKDNFFDNERDALEFILFLSHCMRSYFNSSCSKIFADVIKIVGNIDLKWYHELVGWYKDTINHAYADIIDIVNDKKKLTSIVYQDNPPAQILQGQQEKMLLFCDIRNNECKYQLINDGTLGCILQKQEWNRDCRMCSILFTTDYYPPSDELSDDTADDDPFDSLYENKYLFEERSFVCDKCIIMTKIMENCIVHNLSEKIKIAFNEYMKNMRTILCSDVIFIITEYLFNIDEMKNEIEKMNRIIGEYSELKK